MPHVYADAHLHDTASEAWRLICLARWVLADRVRGADFVNRYERRHGRAAAEALKQLANEQWAIRAQWRRAPASSSAAAAAGRVRDLFSRGD